MPGIPLVRDGLRPARRVDVALAVVVAVLQIGGAALAAHRPHHHGTVNAASIALLAVGPLALLARRRHPASVLGITFAAALVYSALNYYPRGLMFLALVVAFWTVMMAGQRLLGWLSILAGFVLFVVVLPLAGAQAGTDLVWVSGIAAWMLVLATAAEIVRARREHALETARTRTEHARRVAGDERLRIARELHDVLAHNISLINVQAGVALHLLDDDQPEQTRAALGAIKHASKDALGELRSVLDVLRQPGDPPPRTPADSLARLEKLIGNTRDVGLPVHAEINGTPRPLPAGVDLAAYRIVQEALTNIVRHAPGAATTVQIRYGQHELALRIENDGNPNTPNGANTAGSGLAGMRERATALGGKLRAGPRPTGGFEVHATLPLDQPR